MTSCSLSASHWPFFSLSLFRKLPPLYGLLRCFGTGLPNCFRKAAVSEQHYYILPPKIAKTGNLWFAGSVVYPETAQVRVIKTLTGASCVFAVPLKSVPFWITHCLRFCDVVSGITWTLCLLTWIRSRAMNMTGSWCVRSSSKNLVGGDNLRDLSVDGSIMLYIRKCAYHVTLMGFPIFARIARHGSRMSVALHYVWITCFIGLWPWRISGTYPPKRRNIVFLVLFLYAVRY